MDVVLGFRSAVQSPSAYLASAGNSSDLAHHILPPHFRSCPLLHYDEAITVWLQSHDQTPPVGSDAYKQNVGMLHMCQVWPNRFLMDVQIPSLVLAYL